MKNPSPRGGERVVSRGWEDVISFFVHNKLVVFVLVMFVVGGGVYVSPFNWEIGDLPRDPVPVDAIPDIGENQQIVFTPWPGRSPRDVEDQISYPLTTALSGIPGVRTVRSSSMFGISSIFVIFEDGVEFYWSRSRVLEKLSSLPAGTLPDGIAPALGPDATALGQVFWYTLEGRAPDGRVVGGWDLHELRSIQDWTVRFSLQAVPGVSEVASVGGHVREYQVDVDPEAMLAHGVTLDHVAKAVRESNLDVGARTLEINRAEYLVRSLGFIKSPADLEATVIHTRDHTPIRIRDVARVSVGPAQRRGILDDAGAEAVGGVVVARYGANPMEVIQSVKEKIARIAPGLPRRELDNGEISQVTIVPFYDRSVLIEETLSTLSTALWQQILVTVIVVLILLRNLRSSLLISAVLPLAVMGAFVAMKWTGVDANIMALAGIAIAIGTMVDMGIVFVENIVEHLNRAPPEAARGEVVAHAAAEVAPAVLTSVLTTVVSFLPVFALGAAEGKLFSPLAYTKSFAMVAALLVSLFVVPALAHFLIRPVPGAVGPGTQGLRRVVASSMRAVHLRDWVMVAAGVMMWQWSPLGGLAVATLGSFRLAEPLLSARFRGVPRSVEIVVAVALVTGLLIDDWMPLGSERGFGVNALFVCSVIAGLLSVFAVFQWVYTPVLRWSLRHKLVALSLPTLVTVLGFTAWLGLDKVFSSLPRSVRLSSPVAAAAHTFPGFGREFMPPFDEGSFLYMPTTMPHASIGQASEMLRQLDAAIAAIPEVERAVGKLGRADSPLDPAPISMFETIVNYVPEYRVGDDGKTVRQWRDHIRTPRDIWDEIVVVAQAPGLTSAPMLMPINTRIVMLQSGMRAPMGIKVYGPDLESIESFGLALEDLLKEVPSIRGETLFADRVVGKPYIEIDIDREAIGRFGLSIGAVQRLIQVALGGRTLTRTVEGRERYPVRVRYMREERDSIEALRRVLVPTPSGEQIPLEQFAVLRYVKGPQVIKSEDTFLTSYVLFDRQPGVAEVSVVEQTQAFIAESIRSGRLQVPAGVSFKLAGSYENQVRSEKRLRILVPIALGIVFLVLYLQFRRVSTTLIIYSGVTVCLGGGFLLLWLYAQPSFLNLTFLDADMRDLFRVGTVNMSVAVWVGFIALLGIATDAGVVMATYLSQRFRADPPRTVEDIHHRALEAGRRRVRPCLMTTATTALALLPVVTSQGRGADVMLPMALPSIGGMGTILLTLFTVPLLYAWVEEVRFKQRIGR
ncbi:MAG: efflux RND transporter permease subunit [Nannocystaceae bacterium]